MAISLVSHVTAKGNNATTSAAIDTTGANLLVAVIGAWGTTATVSDNKGNTWVLAKGQDSGNGSYLKIYYVKSPTVGTGHTFSFGAGNFANVLVSAWSGVDTTAPLDATNGAGGYQTGIATGSITPSQSGELIIAGLVQDTSTLTPVIDSGLSVLDTVTYLNGINEGGGHAYLVQGTAAPINPTWSNTGFCVLSAAVVSFKAGATSVTVTVPKRALTIAALVPALILGTVRGVPQGSFAFSGKAPTVSVGRVCSVPKGSAAITGRAPTLSTGYVRAVPKGSAAVIGRVPALAASIAVPKGAAAVSGKAPAVSVGNVRAVPKGTLSLAGKVPTVAATANKWAAVPKGTATFTGKAPAVAAGNAVAVTVPRGTLGFTGRVPSANVTANKLLPVPVGALSLSGRASYLRASVPRAALVFTGYAPGVTAAAGKWLAVPKGTLSLAGRVPTVTASANKSLAVPQGALVFIPRVPSLILPVALRPGADTLIITGRFASLWITSSVPASPTRILRVATEARAYAVPPETRVYVIAESWTDYVPA